jgi:hypothetical protein
MTTAWGGQPPGITGTHWGHAGIGVLGSEVLANTVGGTQGAGIIIQATNNGVIPSSEYRLYAVTLPAGFRINEDGSGSSTASGIAVMKLYKDGIEL